MTQQSFSACFYALYLVFDAFLRLSASAVLNGKGNDTGQYNQLLIKRLCKSCCRHCSPAAFCHLLESNNTFLLCTHRLGPISNKTNTFSTASSCHDRPCVQTMSLDSQPCTSCIILHPSACRLIESSRLGRDLHMSQDGQCDPRSRSRSRTNI